jgi:hypothetical protein
MALSEGYATRSFHIFACLCSLIGPLFACNKTAMGVSVRRSVSILFYLLLALIATVFSNYRISISVDFNDPTRVLATSALDREVRSMKAGGGYAAKADTPTPVVSSLTKQTIPKQPVKEIQVDTRFPSTELVLLRAIGNPLPPRHDSEQAINNLKFTLENEYEYPHLEKQWVLNRLADEDLVTRLADLMESHGQKYTVIPFNLTEYDEVQYRFDYKNPGGDVVHSPKYASHEVRLSVDEAVNQDKNVFVTNQNAARNTMVELGQAYAGVDWVLPWDGNCFLHPSAYQDIYQKLQAMPSTHKYAVTPMNRAMTNEEVLQDLYNPKPIEEPQVIFHKTAIGRFHPLLRYGRRNKVEFLQRLKVKGPWDKWPPLFDYETKHLGPFFQLIPDLQQDEPTKEVGWVTRLSSGKQHLEVKGSIIARGIMRFESIISLLGKLDTRAATELHGYQAGQLLYYDEESLVRDRQLYNDGDMQVKSVVEDLLHLARQAITAGPWSVMDKPDDSVAVSGDKHDYFHLSPYFWPDERKQRTNPNHMWKLRDGKRYPGTKLYEEGSEKFDRTRVKDFHYNTTILGLAYFMTGEKQYAEVAAQNVRTWFLDPETRMNPNMKYSQVRNGYNHNTGTSTGIIEMKDLYFLLDAVHLIERDGFLTDIEQQDLRAWLAEYLDWLENSEIGREEYSQKNNHGLYFDVQAVAITSFINDTAKMIWYLERSTSRLLAHSKDDGSMPQELSRPICEHYQMFTLQGWSILSRMAQTVNRNLWIYQMSNGTSPLCRAAKYAVPFFGREKKCENSTEVDENVTRWWPLLQDSKYYCPSLRNQDQHWPIAWSPKATQRPPGSSYEMPNLFDPHDAIAPFWNLGLVYGNLTWPSSIATTKLR